MIELAFYRTGLQRAYDADGGLHLWLGMQVGKIPPLASARTEGSFHGLEFALCATAIWLAATTGTLCQRATEKPVRRIQLSDTRGEMK